MPQIREQIAMVHLPPSKTLKYLFHVRENTIAIRTLMVWTRWCFWYKTQYYAAFRG